MMDDHVAIGYSVGSHIYIERPIHFDSISLYLYIVYIDSEIYYRLGNNLQDCRFGLVGSLV
jgi:hypothetical protein